MTGGGKKREREGMDMRKGKVEEERGKEGKGYGKGRMKMEGARVKDEGVANWPSGLSRSVWT